MGSQITDEQLRSWAKITLLEFKAARPDKTAEAFGVIAAELLAARQLHHDNIRECVRVGHKCHVENAEQAHSIAWMMGKLEEKTQALYTELLAARADVRRLDCLEKKRYGVLPGMPKEKHDYWYVRTYDPFSEQIDRPTIRGVIDAMEADNASH